MAANVKWYGDNVLAQVKVASQKMADEAALLIEGQAKANIVNNGQVDTGFMLNSTYSVTSGANSHSAGSHPERPDRKAAPAQTPGAGAVVGVAAEYALWQELEQSFLFRAAEDVASGMQAQIVDAGKAVLDD